LHLIVNAKIGIIFTFFLIILALAFINKQREQVSSTVWSFIAALTIANIIMAVVW